MFSKVIEELSGKEERIVEEEKDAGEDLSVKDSPVVSA